MTTLFQLDLWSKPTYLYVHAERVCKVQYDLVGVSLCALAAVCQCDIMDWFRLLFSPPGSFFHADPLYHGVTISACSPPRHSAWTNCITKRIPITPPA